MNQIPPIYRWRVYFSAFITKHFSLETLSVLLRDLHLFHTLCFCAAPYVRFITYPFYLYLLPGQFFTAALGFGVFEIPNTPNDVFIQAVQP